MNKLGDCLWFVCFVASLVWLFRRRKPLREGPTFTITSMSQDDFVEMCLDMEPGRVYDRTFRYDAWKGYRDSLDE